MGPHQEMPDLFGRATLVLGEHARFGATVETLRNQRALLQGEHQPPPPELVATVMDFTEQLLAHFEAEERADYFGALAESPELRQTIAELTAEHREMERLVRELQAAAVALGFLSRLTELLDKLTAHERREGDLLRRFFGGEMG